VDGFVSGHVRFSQSQLMLALQEETEMQTVDVEKQVNAQIEPPKKVLPSKLIVAVHGIGDQFQFATIQSVANRFCATTKAQSVFPLGRFYENPIGTPPLAYLLPFNLDDGHSVGFTEVYWANIPRIPAKEGYTIEESKKWGKTVIERLRRKASEDSKDLTPNDLEMAKGLLEEMIDTITVLERLLLIAQKAGVFKFDLKDTLVSYLGDVQIVTDFKKYRDQILRRFFQVMNGITEGNPQAEIYIVAHSEGTVVAFLSLLEAACGNVPADLEEGETNAPPLTCDWVKQVRGFMTIGSPIDKHLTLWPELWEKYEKCGRKNLPEKQIQWRNYYDYGDPIGFELDRTIFWIREHGWDDVFEFELEHNYKFGRYFFPGKAHNDYWNDKEVFDHFIINVVQERPLKAGSAGNNGGAGKQPHCLPAPEKVDPPKDKLWVKFFCNVVPYTLVFGLILLAVYFLYKAVNEYEAVDPSAAEIFRGVVGITCLLAGLTVAAQIPRLTRVWTWRFAAFAIFAVSAVAYRFITPDETHDRLGSFIASRFASDPTTGMKAAAVISLATVIAVLVYLIGRKWPRAGLRVLLGLSFVGLLITVGVGVISSDRTTPAGTSKTSSATTNQANEQAQPATQQAEQAKSKATGKTEPILWPLFLATAAFLYLWWLAALIFDLVIVWHYYIRRSMAIKRLHKYMPPKSAAMPPKSAAHA
jgi:hypothetical protein